MQDHIIKKLIDNIDRSNQDKSSFWKKYLPAGADYLNHFKHLGFGSYTKKNRIKNYFEILLAKIIFGEDIFQTKTYESYKTIFDKIERHIDNDTIRHIFTFEKLKKYLNPKSICIIGDGKINGVLGAYLTFPSAKIFSVNLSEVLINDYIILDQINIFKKSITLVDDISSSKKNKILSLVPSNHKKFLLNKNIELFINIVSFQEMTKIEIESYFEIIKNNKSKLYCCNREYKKLPGGEELFFDKYPFTNVKKFFYEDCPWHQKFYSLQPPFIHDYDGNIKHCLVEFN
jgi:hypothetical protein